MDLIEIRDLDGPNYFTLQPAIVIAFELAASAVVAEQARATTQAALSLLVPSDPAQAVETLVLALHRRAGLPGPGVGRRALDTPGHHAAYFTWERRAAALAIAEHAWQGVTTGLTADPTEAILAALDAPAEDDRPLWVRDAERRLPAVGITGTNGKTTTTRLLAHVLRQAGKRAGWSSSTGVYIEGEQVIAGDYTGPTGARRVLDDQGIDVAVLETARGGILLRGLAYESNDVGVYLNVSADHLGLHGVSRVETLAEVKSVVVRVTKPGGLVVLNADDPLVLAQQARVRAPVLLFSQRLDHPEVSRHVTAGGRALLREGDAIVYLEGATRCTVAALADVPVTFGGSARHMVENALAATGAAIGLGLDLDTIARGLRSFRNDPNMNPGRLNIFRLDGRTVVVDYAHNESGLEALLAFTRSLMGGAGRLIAIIGTAGDRQDSVLRGLGRIAGTGADRVYVKENPHYLRGRESGVGTRLMREGIDEAGAGGRLAGVATSEYDALIAALDSSSPGDAIAIMCVEDQIRIIRELRARGADESG
jgi:cyanophycin synthetase